MMKFADRDSNFIVNPKVGTEFDDVDEAFQYYNLYSWECGFGIRWGKERVADNRFSRQLPVEQRYKLSREFNCSCSVSDPVRTFVDIRLCCRCSSVEVSVLCTGT
jgi:hypothetical protein